MHDPTSEHDPSPPGWFEGRLARLDAALGRRGPYAASLVGVLMVAAALRAVYFTQLARTPGFARPLVDSTDYVARAHGVLDGTWPDGVFFLDPLYPFLLAGHFALFGDGIAGVLIAQMVLGVATVALIQTLAASFLKPSAALLAGLLAALYPVSWFFEGLVLKAAWASFSITLSLVALVRAARGGWAPAAGAGLCVGLGALLRGNLLVLVPIGAVWLATTARARVKQAAAFVGAALVAIAPVTLHNVRAGDVVLTPSNLGANLYVGNGAHNDTGTYRPPPGVRGSPVYEREDFRRRAEEARGRELAPSEVSGYWIERTLDDARADPGRVARLALRKLALVVNAVEVPDNASFARTRDEVPILRGPWPCFGVLTILATAAVVLARGRPGGRPEGGLLVAVAAALAATLVVFFVNARFRLVLVPPLVVLAASLPHALSAAWRERALVRGSLALVLAGGALFATTRDVYEERSTMLDFNAATLAFQERDWDAADRHLERALEGDPDNVRAWVLRGLVRAEQGRDAEAEATLRHALELAPRDPEVHTELGLFLGRRERLEEARTVLVRALELGARDSNTVVALADIERRQGDIDAARALLNEHLARADDDTAAWHLLGVVELEAGAPAAAEAALRQACELGPEKVIYQLHLARSLRRQGRRDEARAIYRVILATHPDDARARQALRTLGGE